MLNKIKQRSGKDDGNSIIILGIMLIMATLLIGGMLLDISKAFQMKSSYVDAARKAAQAGVREQNTQGFLKAEAAAEAIRVYENIARPSVIKDGYMSHCNKESIGRDVDITVYFMYGGTNNGYADNTFVRGPHSITMNNKDVRPGDELSDLMTKLNLSYTTKIAIQDAKYKGIEIEVVEETPNVILPGASKISLTDNNIDFNCQLLGIREGASQYIGETGLYY